MKQLRILIVFSLIGMSGVSYSQIKISGNITSNEDPDGVLGVNVVELGTQNGTITGIDGLYVIEVRDITSVLQFSYVGYISEEVEVGSKTVIDLHMRQDVENIEEVVVVGYGSQKKSDITGSVSSLKPKTILNLPVSRADEAIQGRIAGVNVMKDNAAPNAETTIRIRGSSSLLGNNNPLVVIDGFQEASLSFVHPQDIRSMEVLKDASALSIYGSRGANGAILVTTKNGRAMDQGFGISYSSYFAMHQIRSKLDMLNAGEYANRQNQDALELGGIPPFSQEEVDYFQQNGGTDWQDEIFRNAWAQNHHLSLGGSKEKISYYISGDYLSQDGIVRGSSFKKYSLRSNISLEPIKNLTIDLNTFFSTTEDHPVAINTFSGENAGSPINSALLWSPTDPVYADESQTIYTLPSYNPAVGPLTDYNPMALAIEPIKDNSRQNVAVNGLISYNVFPSLNLKWRGAVNLLDDEYGTFINSKPTQIENSESASIYNSRSLFAQSSLFATYSLVNSSNHTLNITGLYETQYGEFNDSWMGARGFISDVVGYDNLGLGQEVYPLSSSRSIKTLRSFMARVNYGYIGKYLLTLTSRWDGSSVFGEENKWAFFPSGALGWNLGKEEFMQWMKEVVTGLKTRISYGYIGNQAIPPGGSIGLIGDYYTYPLDGITLSPGIGVANRAPNPNLKWETTEQLNIGIDMELLRRRIIVVADYYIKNTNDLLFEQPVPLASGYSSQYVNVGSMQNKGIELFIEVKPLVKKVKWVSGLTLAINRNKVTGLLDGNDEMPIGSVHFPGFDNYLWLQVGKPVGQFRGVKYDGVWQADEAELADLYGAIPGSPKGVDQNQDTVINDLDIVVLGYSQPDFTFGWNNSISYNGFTLNLFFQGVQGIEKLNLSKLQLLRGTGADLLDRWTPTNPDTEIPSAIGEAVYGIGNSDRYVEDASYIRLKNLSLSYDIPGKIINRIGMQSARVYISGYNLLTITSYSGFDPESTSSGPDFNSGIDLATYPEQKIYTFGIDITF